MPVLEERQWKQLITEGQTSGLYVVAGEEKYLVKREAQRLIKRAWGQVFPEFNRNEFGNSASIDDIADAVEALPFMAEKKCVSVADFDVEEKNQVELGKLYELMENVPDTTSLVLWYPTLEFDEKKSAKWRNFLKKSGACGKVLLCGRRSGADLRKLLMREAEKAECALSRENADKIVSYAGQDVSLLLHEIEKLCAYAQGLQKESGREGPAEITGGIIEDLVPKSTETTVFLMANALTAGNYEKAYGLLDALFYQHEEPLAILGALSASYVDMYRVRAALESGKPGNAPAEYGDYKGKEFRLRNAERSAKGISRKVLRKSLDLLLEADLALKGSRLEPRLVMDELIAKLLLAAQKEGAS